MIFKTTIRDSFSSIFSFSFNFNFSSYCRLLHNYLAEGWRELHPPGRDLHGAGGLLPGEPLAHQSGELRQPPRGAAEDHQVPHESRHCHMNLNDNFKTNNAKKYDIDSYDMDATNASE